MALWGATTNCHLPSAVHTCVEFARPTPVRNSACEALPINLAIGFAYTVVTCLARPI